MAYVVAMIAGIAFGAGDQYLGSLTAGSVLGAWTWTVSGMSAPWLVLPFVAGMTQQRPRRGAAIGLVVTLAALAGYFAMSHSPMEGVPIDRFFGRVVTMIRTGFNPLWIASGVVTGPLFGFLGCSWRVSRWWVGAALVTAAFCLEPLARLVAGMLSGPSLVWLAEIAVGVVVATAFGFAIVAARRDPDAVPSAPHS
jgi:Family of unknown function (DUF6518)